MDTAGASPAIRAVANFSFEAGPDSVTRARHSIGELIEGLPVDRDDVEAFVSEAVANAVIHAFPEGAPGTISLELSRPSDDCLVVSVLDDGIGIRPSPGRRGLGFGLSLMASLASSLTIRRVQPSGTLIKGTFDFSAPSAVTPIRDDVPRLH